MKLSLLFTATLALSQSAFGQKVVGAAEGFAQGVTGGGNASPVTPKNIQQLTTYLTDKNPRVIILNRTYDFTGSEGKGIIKGKGLRFNGVKNIIVQNIHVTTLNPQYVWGGDAFIFNNAKQVWIDHCTTSLLGRQHYVFGRDKSTAITLSNNHIDGRTSWSAGCTGYHYWTIELVGNGDQITMQNNYIEHTGGRGPALSATTLLHAVNNVWSDIKGHAIEGDTAGKGLFEGNVFKNVQVPVTPDFKGQLNSCPDASAANTVKNYIGRVCQANILTNSGAFSRKDTAFLSEFKGLPIARSAQATTASAKVPSSAGFGRI